MGCYDPKSKTFKTVCKAGNGFDDSTLTAVSEKMRPKMRKISNQLGSLPSWLECTSTHIPDFVINDPWTESPVWEIAGAEFLSSGHHTADGISIRFPRVIRQRPDKDFSTHTNLEELRLLVALSSPAGASILTSHLVEKDDLVKASDQQQIDADTSFQAILPKFVASSLSSSSSGSSNTTYSPLPISYGSVVYPRLHSGRRGIILQMVDNSGRWSKRGVFGAISERWKEPEQLVTSSFFTRMGDLLITKLPSTDLDDKIYFCAIVGQETTPTASIPVFNVKAFEVGVQAVSAFASYQNAGIHMALPSLLIPNLDWSQMETIMTQLLLHRNVPVKIYDITLPNPSKRLCSVIVHSDEELDENDEDFPPNKRRHSHNLSSTFIVDDDDLLEDALLNLNQ